MHSNTKLEPFSTVDNINNDMIARISIQHSFKHPFKLSRLVVDYK